MDWILLTVNALLLVAGFLGLLVFAIYWFELDEKFVRWFEPTFRKMTD